jgi:hypothetical protein
VNMKTLPCRRASRRIIQRRDSAKAKTWNIVGTRDAGGNLTAADAGGELVSPLMA